MAASAQFNDAGQEPAPSRESMGREIFTLLYAQEIGDAAPDPQKIRDLLKKGADLSLYIREVEQTVFQVIESYPDIARHVADLPQYVGQALVAAASADVQDAKRVEKLLASPVIDWSQRGDRGRTALMLASERGYIEIVKLVAEKDPDLKAVDSHGWTALMHAAMEGHKGVAAHLIDKKLPVRHRSPSNYAALDLALVGRNPGPLTMTRSELAVLLARAGANIHEKNEKGISPVDYLVMNAQHETLKEMTAAAAEWRAELRDSARSLGQDTSAPPRAVFKRLQKPAAPG